MHPRSRFTILSSLLFALGNLDGTVVYGFSINDASNLCRSPSKTSGKKYISFGQRNLAVVECSNKKDDVGQQLGKQDSNRILSEDGLEIATPLSTKIPHFTPPVLPISAVVLLTALVLIVPAAGMAVDHPVDNFHLNIPNPIPDADPRYFLSGGLCAAASHGVTTPIDVVKTRIQANPELYGQGSLWDSTTKILETDGSKALLAGLGPTVIGYGLEGAAKFGLYESLKPEFAQLLHLDSPAVPYLIASVVAGAAASLMLCPMEQTRIRLVTDPNFAPNFLTGIPRLVEESGVGSLFSGLLAMLSKQVPYTFSKQVSFDAFASLLYGLAASASLAANDVKLEVSFFAALLASVLACIMSHPGDVILTATYKGSDLKKSFGSVVSEIYEDKGIQGFFAGISARFVHVGAIITSQLVLYDIVKQLLGLPATGTS